MWIGIDDTDSRKGGCTTFICYMLVHRFHEKGYCLKEYPRLIRLNPQVPWKTRGNGAVAFQIGKSKKEGRIIGKRYHDLLFLDEQASDDTCDLEEVKHLVKDVLHTFAEMDDELTNPAFVISSHPFSLHFYQKAVHEIVSIEEAKEVVETNHGYYELMKNGRGLIGATAALCWDGSRDHTYELINYRLKENWKTDRGVDDESVKKLDDVFPSTFNNYDYQNSYNCITPHSPCPILFGIRGDNPQDLISAQQIIRSEPSMGWLLFISNQGTDDHLRKKKINSINPYQSVITRGVVTKSPVRIQGGHLLFSFSDQSNSIIDCAAYEPTKQFRNIVQQLCRGDEIEVYGGVRQRPLTINIEKIKVIRIVDIIEKIENPVCPICHKHMKSKGKEQGFVCKKCHTTSHKAVLQKRKRMIQRGMYEVPMCAQRHLAKPMKRM